METAAILAIGDEVLNGEVVNTNAAWIARRLLLAGIRPTHTTVVGDDDSQIQDAFRYLLERADLVFTIGGLGPTHDDRTKEALGAALGRALVVDPDTHTWILSRHSRGPGFELSAARQATVLAGADVWRNPAGLAPGQHIVCEADGLKRHVIILPGPPRELEALFLNAVEPWLREMGSGRVWVRETYAVYDLPESQVGHYLAEICAASVPRVGIYTAPGRVEVRFEASSNETEALPAAIQTAVDKAREALPVPLYHLSGKPREAVILDALAKRGLSLSALESFTGGLLLGRLIGVAGASHVIKGGAVVYQDPVKMAFGVPAATIEEFGAVSDPTARAMARAARMRFASDLGMSTTGFAGPQGGTAEEPVGSFYVALSTKDGERVLRRQMRRGREEIRHTAVEIALNLLWEYLGLLNEV